MIPPGVRHRRVFRLWFWAALLFALLVLGIIAWAAMRSSAEPAARYRTAPVMRRTIESVVEAAGKLDVANRVEVPAPENAQLSEILVREGATVAKGDVLARLDAVTAGFALTGARAALRGAEQRVKEAQAALDAARDARERLERLLPRGLVAESEVVSARSNETKSRAALSAAQAERTKASSDRSAAEFAEQVRTLRAPIEGVVLLAPKRPGAVVAPEQGPLFVIGGSLDELTLEVHVPEASIGQIRAAQKATFTVPAYGERPFEAEVQRVLLEADRDGGAVSYPVLLRATNPSRELLPGMSVTVRIRVATVHDVLAVRDAALRFAPANAPEQQGGARIWVSPDARRTRALAVLPGVSDGVYTEVRPSAGQTLSAGERVVIGRVTEGTSDDSGPGISLGGKR